MPVSPRRARDASPHTRARVASARHVRGSSPRRGATRVPGTRAAPRGRPRGTRRGRAAPASRRRTPSTPPPRGSTANASSVGSSSALPDRSSSPVATACATAMIAPALAPGMPKLSRGASASRSAVGNRRSTAPVGAASGSPNRSAMRARVVRAPATDTCCPTIARTASSNPSAAPGRRVPGAATHEPTHRRVVGEGGVDRLGVGVEIEQAPRGPHHARERRHVVAHPGHAHPDHRFPRIRLELDHDGAIHRGCASRARRCRRPHARRPGSHGPRGTRASARRRGEAGRPGGTRPPGGYSARRRHPASKFRTSRRKVRPHTTGTTMRYRRCEPRGSIPQTSPSARPHGPVASVTGSTRPAIGETFGPIAPLRPRIGRTEEESHAWTSASGPGPGSSA